MKNVVLLIFSVHTIMCVQIEQDPKKEKFPLPYFRRRVEEITDDTPVEKVKDDSHSNLLSLLVKNVKELFNEFNSDDRTEGYEVTYAPTKRPTLSTNKDLVKDVTVEAIVNDFGSGEIPLINVFRKVDTTLSENPPEDDFKNVDFPSKHHFKNDDSQHDEVFRNNEPINVRDFKNEETAPLMLNKEHSHQLENDDSPAVHDFKDSNSGSNQESKNEEDESFHEIKSVHSAPISYFKSGDLASVNDIKNSDAVPANHYKSADTASDSDIGKDHFLPGSNEFSSEHPEILILTTAKVIKHLDPITVKNTNDIMLYENFSLHNRVVDVPTKTEMMETIYTTELVESTSIKYEKNGEKRKKLKSIEKSDTLYSVDAQEVTPLTSISSYILESTNYISRNEQNKTCIQCNNVLTENCNDPKHKIVPSVVCKRESDLCYSMHTPFGMIDRGCFNINFNLTTYVCSCNLCNYISISEMPYFFSRREDWVDNVFELSRTKNFRQSIFKDMACLKCEVNTTVKTRSVVESVNCLEGNIEHLPVEECSANEICGVKAKRADGYIWRGCIKKPLYNYWISLCDHDLCNFDRLYYIYEP